MLKPEFQLLSASGWTYEVQKPPLDIGCFVSYFFCTCNVQKAPLGYSCCCHILLVFYTCKKQVVYNKNPICLFVNSGRCCLDASIGFPFTVGANFLPGARLASSLAAAGI